MEEKLFGNCAYAQMPEAASQRMAGEVKREAQKAAPVKEKVRGTYSNNNGKVQRIFSDDLEGFDPTNYVRQIPPVNGRANNSGIVIPFIVAGVILFTALSGVAFTKVASSLARKTDDIHQEVVTEDVVEPEVITGNYSSEEREAIARAYSYLSCSEFSRQGLIDMLSSEYGENYSVELATKAVEAVEKNGGVDWGEQAYKCAKSYLRSSNFSRDGLIKMLSGEYGEKFTTEQAMYAVSEIEANNEVDWNEQARLKAEHLKEILPEYSAEDIREDLCGQYGEGFTEEQADYAIRNMK